MTTISPNMTLFVASVTEMPTKVIERGPPSTEYVPFYDTIADIALREKSSIGLIATSITLLSVVVVTAFGLNIMLFCSILASYKLRKCLLYQFFCVTATLNLIDTVLIMFISLLYIANDHWFLGETFCRLNVCAQQFVFLMSLFIIMLMALERALGLIGEHLVRPSYFGVLTALFTSASSCLALPTFFHKYPVRVYRYRYLCGVGSRSPVSLAVVQIFVYGGCFFALLLCFGSVLRSDRRVRHDNRHLPVKPQDFGAFIMESRALQDYLLLVKLVLFLTITYIIVEGPYIFMCLFVQIRNSGSMIQRYGEIEMPQEVDTLLSWLRFFFPLIQPLMILGTCSEIWTEFKNLLFCHREMTQNFSAWHKFPSGAIYPCEDNVLTLVATADGLQLRVPANFYDNLSSENSNNHINNNNDTTAEVQINESNCASKVPTPESRAMRYEERLKRARELSDARRRKRKIHSHSPGTRYDRRKNKNTSDSDPDSAHKKNNSLESNGFYFQTANEENNSSTESDAQRPPQWRYHGYCATTAVKKSSFQNDQLNSGKEETISPALISVAYKSVTRSNNDRKSIAINKGHTSNRQYD